MLDNPKNRNGFKFVMGVCAVALTAGLSTARAQDEGAVSTAPAQTESAAKPEKLDAVHVNPGTAVKPDKPYFIEFRARSAQSYGHTFLVHGRVGQRITRRDVVGLHPATESPIPWMIGHLVPVVSETGASDGDAEEMYVIARYRILLSESEYRRAVALMRKMQASSPVWHAAIYNCNRFVGDIAQALGLRAPMNSLQYPREFITELRNLNGGRRELSGGGSQEANAERHQNAERRQEANAARRQVASTPRRQGVVNGRQEAAAAPASATAPHAPWGRD